MQFIGYGNTPDCNGCNKALFLKLVFDNIVGFDRILGETTKAVIVSPSMSGSWSLPFIQKHQGSMKELHIRQHIFFIILKTSLGLIDFKIVLKILQAVFWDMSR